MRILIVEDDIDIGQSLMRALKDADYSVDWIRDGAQAKEAMVGNAYSIVLLDLGLPGSDGIDVLATARGRACTTPVLIVTARDDIETRIRGLDIGADDYLLKPFNTAELLARIRAVMRRHAGAAVSVLGDEALSLNLDTHELCFKGHREGLSVREFSLMAALLERPGMILSRAQLESRLYGWGEEVESNAVAVLIHGVRKKFGHDVIRNIRGFGWTIDLAARDEPTDLPPADGNVS
ncbi:response regulator [Paraburkholderia sp. J67]|uniref:response regulator n=1 Tax=Paraburkholderia sp. J67 TaxID=2805435 RepID=UPI002ABE5E33|nr:response regulator [Paraburkholderia sp. J67]